MKQLDTQEDFDVKFYINVANSNFSETVRAWNLCSN